MAGILNLVFSASSSSRPHYQHKAPPRSLDGPPPLPPASSWARHRDPNHRRTVSFDATGGDSPKEDPRSELVVLRKENRRFKRKIEHLARQKEVYHDLLEKSGIGVPEVLETSSSHLDEGDEPMDTTANLKRSDTVTARTNTPDPIPYWINASNPQAKLLQVLIAILLGRARTILRVSPFDPAKIESLATEALAHSFHSSLKKDRALIAHCQFYLGVARFGQGRYSEAAEYLDVARAAVAGRYLEGKLVDEWVDRCRDAMEKTQSTIWTDHSLPSEPASQANNKGKGKDALHGWKFPNSHTPATALLPPPPLHPQRPTTPSAAAPPSHHRHTSSATTIRPPSPPPSTPFRPSYLHSYASASRSPSRSPPPLPADFPLLALVNSQGNSSATIMPTSPNAFSPGGAYSSPPSSLGGSPEMAQGAFGEGTPGVPTHRRGRTGGDGSRAGISGKLAFWEGQRGAAGGGGDESSVEGGQQPRQQQGQSPSPSFPVPEPGEDSDNDNDSEDEQRRRFLADQSEASFPSPSSSDSDSSDHNDNGAVLSTYLPSSRTHSHRSDSSLFPDRTTGIQSGEESPPANHTETVATFWSSRANSIRSDAAGPPSPTSLHSRPSSVHRHPPSQTYLPGARPSRAHSLLSQASSLCSVAEGEEEDYEGEEEAAGMSARERAGQSRVGSRGGVEGTGSEKEGAVGAAGYGVDGSRRRKKKRTRRERKALRAGAAGGV